MIEDLFQDNTTYQGGQVAFKMRWSDKVAVTYI